MSNNTPLPADIIKGFEAKAEEGCLRHSPDYNDGYRPGYIDGATAATIDWKAKYDKLLSDYKEVSANFEQLSAADSKREYEWTLKHDTLEVILNSGLENYKKLQAEHQAMKERAEGFAKWMDEQRNMGGNGLWSDMKIWGKENACQIMYNEYQKQLSTWKEGEANQEGKGKEGEG